MFFLFAHTKNIHYSIKIIYRKKLKFLMATPDIQSIADDLLKSNMEKCYENYILIDVGANLTNKKYGRDLDSVVQRAKDSGKCLVC